MKRASILLLLFVLFAVPNVSQAHTVTEFGDYAIIAAWEKEPPVIGEWNAIRIDIFNTDGGISASDVNLTRFELVAGEKTRPAAPSQASGETVSFTVSFIPTVEGEIGARMVGTLGGEPLDITVYPEKVEPVGIIQFPDVQLANGDLQTGLIALEERIAAQQTQVYISYVVGGLGVLAGVAGVWLGRKKEA